MAAMREKSRRYGMCAPGLALLAALVCPVTALAAGLEPAAMSAPAPEFTLPTGRGEVSLSQLRGQVVYVDFWASWCGPCRKSFPWMNDLHARYGAQGLAIVAINMDTERKQGAKFLEKYPAAFTIAYDPEGKVAAIYRVAGMPSSYLVDRQGRLRAMHQGFREDDAPEIETEIRALLAQP